ncbi:pyridoxal phosphate-dependent aminotransferase [Cupriavidus sp. KK10]|jgi:aspartate/methionine/tyrosine aminotransferase|uniref:pyridoxal phosphate-dependent aminotransferase n=1 Tax=Cupriavidus sp. KK10 TaxID=1478019 RepID=UPI001BA9BA4C|nr:pyridoxal phosphate-dependent aminotransferase [Cupriavidus sp. KK10]QUN27736.1 pyridoxal phosphate-dependent aminotransferase [Cupriavidus sp. KK10]
MSQIEEKFAKLGTENAPGQEVRQSSTTDSSELRGDSLPGVPVDFSHGDVNRSAFEATPGSLDEFIRGVKSGGEQAYTEYRGRADIRESLATHLAAFTGAPVSAATELIITPGTQGALFLAVAATVSAGDKVAIVRPDYFANRKLVEFMGGHIVPITLDYLGHESHSGIDLSQLEAAFKAGAKTFIFSNPNNPTGVIYSQDEIQQIATLANRYGATVIVDQLYSRLLYPGRVYSHLRATDIDNSNVVTIMGPSKTESLSGYRLGVAFGSARLIDRMEKLQAIVSLRAPGYSQAVLRTWFDEHANWMQDRIAKHQAIRDDLIQVLGTSGDVITRVPEAGSYLFPRLPKLAVTLHQFVRNLRYQASVIVTPGTEFCPDSTDSIRLNFSQNHEAAVAAVERIVELVHRYRD